MDVNRTIASLCLISAPFFAGIASGQARVPTRLTRQPDFAIPFHLSDAAGETSEVHLHVSSDHGRQWTLYERQRSDARGFQFRAREDGEYWFAVRTITGRDDAMSQQRLQPELKVIVDTRQPRLDLRVFIDSTGKATASWTASDSNLAANSFRMQYQDDNGQWQDVLAAQRVPDDLRTEWQDQSEWWIRTRANEARIRAEILDRAGNVTVVQKRVAIENVASRGNPPQTRATNQRPTNQRPTNQPPTNERYAQDFRGGYTQSPQGRFDLGSQDRLGQGPQGQFTQDTPNRFAQNPRDPRRDNRGPLQTGVNTPAQVSSNARTNSQFHRASAALNRDANRTDSRTASRADNRSDNRFAMNRSGVGNRGNVNPTNASRSDANRTQSREPASGGVRSWADFRSGINSLIGGVQHSQDTHGAASVREINNQTGFGTDAQRRFDQSRFDTRSFAQNRNTGSRANPPLNANTATRATASRNTSSAFDRSAATPNFPSPTYDSQSVAGSDQQQPASSDVFGPVAQNRAGQPGVARRASRRPRIISSPNLTLDYETYGVGSRGPQRVELWFTRDDGENWELYGADADNQSPFEVRLRGEGLYGFRLAIQDYNRPAPATPVRGDEADMWVGVDWTKPTGRITSARFDGGRSSGEMTIEWIAEDALLAEQPISLSYAASPDGPWIPIASNLRNSGSYRWRIDPRTPQGVHLQLAVSDLAGNVTSDVFDTSAAGDGRNPGGRITDVQPLRRTTNRPYTYR